jgi:hypothetical protein
LSSPLTRGRDEWGIVFSVERFPQVTKDSGSSGFHVDWLYRGGGLHA